VPAGVTTPREQQAADRLESPEGHAPPPGDYTSWDEYMQAIELAETWWRADDAQRGLKAMRLSPSLLVCRDLLAGRRVFRSALDQKWARRYGL
jgi:hypothetical protein